MIQFPNSITFKLSDEQMATALSLRDTFEGSTWAEVGRWLLTDPEVRALIRRRVTGSETLDQTSDVVDGERLRQQAEEVVCGCRLAPSRRLGSR